ncbi:MAG: Uma2 family endonuclease [Gemmataceae bacterium]
MTANPPRLSPPPPPGPRLWTREEYYRLAALGFFDGQRVERIGGELVVMSPQDWLHTCSTDKAFDILRELFRPGYWVRCQFPMEFSLSSDPEPDVSVVPGARDDYSAHPNTAVLIVEVSNTTLAFDRGRKASLYASAGVPDYWVIDVNDRRLEVCRDPQPDAAEPFGWAYASRTWLTATEPLTPLAAPAARIPVVDLLP